MKQRLKAVALAIGCALTVAPACAEPVQLTPLDKTFTLQVLGSGGPISDDLRASSSEVIWWKGKSRILIDAGGGVYLRFGQAGAKLEEVDFIGITHFHTDHVTDLPALLKGAYFFERSDPLDLAGPEAGSAFPSMSGYFDALFNKDKGAYAYLSGFKDCTDGLFPITLHDVPYQSPQPHTVYQQ
ncbi:MAG: MBL fold metallo-hydrolase, partial [Aeromonas veronii]